MSILFLDQLPTHTYSDTQGQFVNHMNVQFCNCKRPLPLLSVLYDDTDDYRGGSLKKKEKKREEKKKAAVSDDVMWMRFKSCPPGSKELAELALFFSFCFVHQFPLLQESHVQYTRDKQHVWFRQKTERKTNEKIKMKKKTKTNKQILSS